MTELKNPFWPERREEYYRLLESIIGTKAFEKLGSVGDKIVREILNEIYRDGYAQGVCDQKAENTISQSTKGKLPTLEQIRRGVDGKKY